MHDARWNRIDDLFRASAALPIEQRRRFLDDSCPDDPALAQEIADLLVHASAGDFLETPALGGRLDLESVQQCEADEELRPGESINQYRVERVIAQGGMATVYQARQAAPSRSVAIKIPRAGLFASRSGLRRFLEEANILARLRHPGIAQVYETGMHTPPGRTPRPFLAMELVQGALPITALASLRNSSCSERLGLFMQACRAVLHGHQRGIIHRDLKPTNVLVDDAFQVKVIDFGIARVVALDIGQATMHTTAGELFGTIQYMSPEQCDGSSHLLDVRTDVYSLGVLLYELLTGHMPYVVAGLSTLQAARVVCEATPIPLENHDGSLRGDLSTIVATALHKAPSLRYQSVADLLADLERFVKQRPIVARRPTVWHRASLLFRRNRRVALMAAVGLVALFAAGVRSFISERDATAQRRAAGTVLALMNDMLAAPKLRGRPDARVVEMLDHAVGSLDAATELGPIAQQQMRTTIGHTYDHLGYYIAARRQFETALNLAEDQYGARDERTRQAMLNLEGSCFDLGDFEGASRLLEKILPLTLDRYGRKSVESASVINEFGLVNLALDRFDEAERNQLEVRQTRSDLLGESNYPFAQALHNLGAVYFRKGENSHAEQEFRRALAIISAREDGDSATVARYRKSLADVLIAQGRLDEAQALCDRAIEEIRTSLGEGHAFAAGVYHSKAHIAHERGDRRAEERYLRLAYEGFRAASGDTHPRTRAALAELRSCVAALDEIDPPADPVDPAPH